jgi:ferrochelatase
MEVRFDLDIEAAATAEKLGLQVLRAPTVGADPEFVAMILELVAERGRPPSSRRHLGTDVPRPDVCPPDCCPGPSSLAQRRPHP